MRPRKSSSFGRNSKDLVDPYSLMLEGRLDMIRPSLASVLKLEDPYSYPNVPSKESYRQIQKEFDQGPCLQLTSERSRPEAFLSSDTIRDNSHGVPGVVDIKVVKIGILFKREPKRMLYSKSNWKELGAILTASHLYLFKDVSWIKSAILSQSNYTNDSVISSGDGSSEEGIIKASIDGFHPSSVLSTVDMVALFSINLETSQSHAFLLAGRGGTQEAFATSSKEDMEDWMLKINYASAFNTYHIGIHSGIGSRTSPYTGHCLKPKPSFSLLSMRSDRSRVLKRDDDIDNSEIMSTRIWAVDNQLQEIQRKWKIVEEELRKQIRNGNHLKLLAPIQQRTRETVIFSAGKLAAKLDWHWLDRKRLLCYQSMFQTEKEVESELFNCSTSSVSSSSFNFDITKENGENDEKREKMEKEAHVTVSHEENDVQENSEQMNTRDLAESIASSTESVDSLTFSKGKEEITVKSIRKPVATNATETIANSDETQKAPKKGFHQRSLRSTPSKKDRHHQPIPEQHRSVSLIRKNDGDFTLHGKKFSVVQVNPEFVANPAHQRSASQHLTQILDKSKTTDSSKEESQIIANHHIDAKACEDLVNEQYSSDQNMSIDNSYT